MAVLVTGGAGFIGSHIVDKLIEKGYEVIIADNLSVGKDYNINPKAKFYKIDLKSQELEKIFTENQIDYISHHAAQASVSVSMKDPLFDLQQNVAASVNLLQNCKKFGVKKLIAASTAAVYGIPEYLPVDEKHKITALSFYGLSKITMESYIKLFGIDYIIFRYANVYGPRQDALGEAGVISIFIDKMLNDQPIEIHGDGEQTRDFVYVEDIAKANLLAIESDVKNEILNISTNNSISINSLFDVLKTISGYNSEATYIVPREGDIKDSVLDNSKAKNMLNWNYEINLEEGLKNTIKWKNTNHS
ncbi:MAG: NAD-dependent epimerase/dehydratase family protein [Candidatus Gastranaerophilales bacterium]|nr:NAD-dependent epimerase/dehydratase family protein [Candidatus Gastranaerophilales bacterium]